MSRVDRTAASTGSLYLVRIPPFIGYASHHPHDVTVPFALAWMATLSRARGWSVHIVDAWASG